jgi:hypothetical protein
MKINKNSWHYRWAAFWHWACPPWEYTMEAAMDWYKSPIPENLCGYFWWCVLGPIMAIGASVIFGFWFVVLWVLFHIFLALRFLAMLLVRLFGLILSPFPKLLRKSGGMTMAGVVVEYASSTKRKYCPTIEFISGEG